MQKIKVRKLVIPTPYAVGPVNVYLFSGQGVQLVDCGPDTTEALQALERGLAEEHLSLHDIEDVYITHAHPDHCGMAGRLTQFGARVHIEPREYVRLYHAKEHIRRMLAYLEKCAVPEQHLTALHTFYERDIALTASLTDFEPLQAGQSVLLGGEQWECRNFPGHAIGHIGFFQPRCEVLLDGDILMDRLYTSPVLEPRQDDSGERYPSIKLYFQSLQEMKTMGVRVLWPGHGDCVTAIAKRIDQVLVHNHRHKQRVWRALSTHPIPIYQVCVAVYGEQRNILFTLSNVLGQLDLLVDEGKARFYVQHGILCVQKVESSLA